MSGDKRLKIGFLNTISSEWFHLHMDKIIQVNQESEADYLIFESNGDPVHLINNIKSRYPKQKLVFILSGDTNSHIDNECIWFTNALQESGLATNQTQIFVTNPAIFKYYDKRGVGATPNRKRHIDNYFKGTIWAGMREEMYDYFNKVESDNKMTCLIEKNNNYWDWRLRNIKCPLQIDIENEAYKSYEMMEESLLCLCPKGNGNSSMRIIEALGCGSIPILINDFSKPFGISWSEIGLVFDTNKHSWEYIYNECYKLVRDSDRLKEMQKKGNEYFKNVIYGDSKIAGFRTYNNLNTVCFGFSNLIINKLIGIPSIAQ